MPRQDPIQHVFRSPLSGHCRLTGNRGSTGRSAGRQEAKKLSKDAVARFLKDDAIYHVQPNTTSDVAASASRHKKKAKQALDHIMAQYNQK